TVRSSLWDEQAEAAMGHIELARWADAIVIAPASANFLARLAQGLADDLLSTLCLATDRPIYAAPAMNRLMWANAATRDNLDTLRRRGLKLIGPGSGFQACGEVGDGRMSEPAEITALVLGDFRRAGPLAGLHAVVTAGPTREPIDPVRFITNRSSGKQGYALAEALTRLGAEVTLVSGPVHLDTPAGVRRVDVETAQQMLEATLAACRQAQILVGAAAVADYRPAAAAGQKIKKNADTLDLALTKMPTSWPRCARRSRACSSPASPPRPRNWPSTRAASWSARSWTWWPPTGSARARPSTATTTRWRCSGTAASAGSARPPRPRWRASSRR